MVREQAACPIMALLFKQYPYEGILGEVVKSIN
jgi:hypothetical protein